MNTPAPPASALHETNSAGSLSIWKGGSPYSAVLTAFFALLFISGLYLEYFAADNWKAGKLVLIAHLLGGAVFTLALAPWLVSHVRTGPGRSQRRLFTLLGWLLLGKYLMVIGTGILMAVPAALYLLDIVWFWRFETTDLLSFLHLWLSFAAVAGIIAHLTLRHWKLPAKASPKTGHQ